MLFLAPLSSSFAEGDRKVKIAVITDLSAAGAFWGKETAIGAELAAKEINSSNDLDIQLFFYDHKLQTKEAVSVVQKALFVDKVDVVFSDFTATSIAISELVEQQNKILLYSAAARSLLSSNSSAFKSFLNYQEGCRLLAIRLKSEGIDTIAHLKPISEFGDLCQAGVASIYPEVLVEEFHYGEQVQTQIKKFQNKKVQAIISTAYQDDLVNLLKSLAQYNFKTKVYLSSEMVADQILKKFPTSSEQVVGFGYPKVPSTFVQRIKASFPDSELDYPEAVLTSYVHIKQLYQVIRDCPQNNLDCQVAGLNQIEDQEFGYFNFDDREVKIPIILTDF